jgi:hypothetical protein
MKLWLDDERKPPPGYSHWVKSADECIEALKSGKYDHVSLDHDLADEHYKEGGWMPHVSKEKTGQAVVDWMIENSWWPAEVRVHTMNPVGRKNMLTALLRYAPTTTRVWVRFPYEED